jgi:COP9 signalosome complex subunit 2
MLDRIPFYLLLEETLFPIGLNVFRVWFTVCVRIARMYLSILPPYREDLTALLEKMRKSCKEADGVTDDISGKGSLLLELYSIEFEFLDSCPDPSLTPLQVTRRMKSLIASCALANSALTSSKSMGLIREYTGKVLLQDGCYTEAYNEFYEGFRVYTDSGYTASAELILRFVILASMLSNSNINPFDSREVRASGAQSLRTLWTAFSKRDIPGMKNEISKFTDRTFLGYCDTLLESMWEGHLERICACYERISLEELQGRLFGSNWSEETLVRKLMKRILDQRIVGYIAGGVELVMVHKDTSAQKKLMHVRDLSQLVEGVAISI